MIPFSARTFKAKTIRVHSVNAVEVLIDLDFGVSVTKVLSLDGFMASDIPESLRSQALHCLIVLLGGKRLVIQPDPDSKKFWSRKPDIPSRVFLDERVFGSPVGMTTDISGVNGELLDVVPFIKSLVDRGFEVDSVKTVLNRRVG